MGDFRVIGLTTAQANEKLTQYGPNSLPEKRSAGLWLIFIRQFNSPFIYMLFVAALLSFVLNHYVNGLFIFAVLLINATIGTLQEYSAQRAAIALRKMVPQSASVYRDGVICTLDSTDIVPGDIVKLASGDKVPADLQLLNCQELLVNESILTGESMDASKQAEQFITDDAPLAEQSNRVFAGTVVNHGRGEGEVIATGARSQIGLIAKDVSVSGTTKPPLLQRIERFTLRVSYSVLVVIALLFTITLLRGEDLATVFLLGVALAVSAIPEGLPAAITVALAIGMRRMAKVNVIVRKLIAVESLGSCTYIASDKTGTLTVNKMTVKKIILSDGSRYEVSGEGINVHGDIRDRGGLRAQAQAIEPVLLAGLLANEAELSPPENHSSHWLARGDGVDVGFLVLAAKYGFEPQQRQHLYPEIQAIPYESENAYSASINRVNDKTCLFAKGSAERILPMCSQSARGTAFNTKAIERQMTQLANQGYRVLALASKTLGDNNTSGATLDPKSQLKDLDFLGLVGMIDPLRPEAVTAIKDCHNAAIEVGMITGDHPKTALALARQLGIADQHSVAVSGTQLNAAREKGAKAFAKLVKSTQVFARVEPTQKLQIIQQLISDGHFVAVTGDGVNDAPALRHAHVGIAMGKRGTDVARESSDLIITDDNFSSIVQGIKQGRIVYNNIRKVVFLLISTGAAEITLFILSVLFGFPIPLFPIQLLWLNLVTNGIQDVALAFEPAEGDELQQAPRPPKETIFNRIMLQRILINAVVMGTLAFLVFIWSLDQGMSEQTARNTTLLLMVLFENVHVLNSRSESRSIFKQDFFGNPLLLFGMLAAQGIHIAAMYTPGLKDVLNVEPVTLELWSRLLMIALILIIVDEMHKLLLHRHRPVNHAANMHWNNHWRKYHP
ncbi:MAG: HAD-IC family P-type ATPase [Oceanicoccus sp.]|nr:HAD-IC family P-type ATPase [Oceanicoccus sp.]MCP3908710.1 HAD-IC family P-type ATPase [Oceanicoccus sp.]MDG1772482.1 HAD-IC family P-type ATPase [Oceanicoccus sp.]